MEKVFKGMFRPDWDAFYSKVRGYIDCNCGSILQTRQMTREHWQLGHFDTPVNE